MFRLSRFVLNRALRQCKSETRTGYRLAGFLQNNKDIVLKNDFKVGFGMEKIAILGQPPMQMRYFFRIGALTYNSYRLFFIKTLDSS